MVTRSPRLDSRAPSELAVRPSPKGETTPPVTKTNFVGWELWRRPRESDWSCIPDGRSTGTHRNTVGLPEGAGGGLIPGPAGRGGPGRAGRRGEPHEQRHQDGGRGRG